jgi:DNA transformation protein and related proteins
VDSDDIRDLFAVFGLVTVRRMFGGAGVFADGLMIALVSDGVLHLKADEQTIPAFEREGQGPFTYATKHGARSLTSYWRLPERLYDETEELARWAHDALAVARRAALRSRPGAKRPRANAAKARGKRK